MAASNDDIFPVVIIGAGLAGLTAAAHIAARDIPPLVLEADSEWPGGRMAGGEPDTFDYDGRTWSFRPDHGMHALWGNYDNLRATFDRFLDDLVLQPSPGEEWINRWGREVRVIEAGNAVRSRWIPAPFHHLQLLFHPHIWANISPWDFLSLPGFLASVLLTVGFDPVGERRPLDGLMLKDYFRGWTPNLRATFTGLGANLLAAHPDDIPLASFIAALRFYTMLRRDAWRMDYFPANSHDCVVRPMMDRIESLGGMVLPGAEALTLARAGDNWHVRVQDSARGGHRTVVARHVILAVDPLAAERLFTASPDTAEEAASIHFPDAVRNTAIRLWFDESPRDGTPGGMFTGDFLPDNFFWLHRLHSSFAEWHRDTGGSAIEVHLYAKPDVLDLPERNLIIMAVDEVQRAFPRLRGHFVHGAVRSNNRTQTLFRVPSHDSLSVQTPWPGVLACGDWVGYDTPALNMERAVITAIAAANSVLRCNDAAPYSILPPRQAELPVRFLGGLIAILRRLFGSLVVRLFSWRG